MVAHIAGLGWIGKNCLLITREHGPRVRFISVLTNAPLKTVDDPIAQQCNDCIECMKACPVKAIKGKNYIMGEDREERFEFLKCQNYFEKMEKTDKVCRVRYVPLCVPPWKRRRSLDAFIIISLFVAAMPIIASILLILSK